jgi:predicted glycogen debranching enzyme
MIHLDPMICSDFSEASTREWLETNGIGGYAMSSVAGANTRRYHGLLVAATVPPVGRAVLLSKFEETVTVDGISYELSSNQYPGTVYPEGYKYLTGFRLDPFPVWTYLVAGIEIERKLFMAYGENTTVTTWSVKRKPRTSGPISIEVRPLLAFRDHHHVRHQDPQFDGSYVEEKGIVEIEPYPEMPRLYLSHNAVSVERTGHWYRDFEYALERERGFDYREDLYQPFSLRFKPNKPAFVIASTEHEHIADAALLERTEIKRRSMLVAKAGKGRSLSPHLALAADQFIVSRGDGKTVIAGYPWFSDWGRDTMISLNGLTLATNREEIAESILAEFALHISEGMLPNRFPDAGQEPEYNTVDATLWYFEAIRAYVEKTGDIEFVRDKLYDKLTGIIEWHVLGTRYGIKVDTDGLLFAGRPGVQLTWMDAKIGDWVVTPRTGKPVEIQALWYNALRTMAVLAGLLGDSERQDEYTGMADIALDSFNGQFWNREAECLFDVINGEEKDASVRPNQIFAVSLPYTMLPDEMAFKVVKKVEAELLTPVGLRSLSLKDPRYIPVYTGSPMQRDASYHQGTVWGWLIGPFIDAYRKVHRDNTRTRTKVTRMLKGFEEHLSSAMLGQVSEIFDADPPHLPRGCPAQAWSVAELLRVSRARPGMKS